MAKRAANGAGMIHQRKDKNGKPTGLWEARYCVGKDPGTGKLIRKSVYGKSQAEVRQKLTAATKAIDDGEYIEPSRMTIRQWIDYWLENELVGVKVNTVVRYEGDCKNHIKPMLGNVKLSALTHDDVQAFVNKLIKKKKLASSGKVKEETLSAKSVRGIHAVLRVSLECAVSKKYIKVNPASKCKLPKVEKPELKNMDEDAVVEFLKLIKGDRWENLYEFTLFSGVRQGEVLGLSWDCINFKDNYIHVKKQLQKNRKTKEFEITTLKDDESRKVYPAPSIMQLLKNHQAQQKATFFSMNRMWFETDLVFSNETGGHLYPSGVYKKFKRIVRSLGLSDVRFHDMRHTYAIMNLANGADVKSVQENLGHYSAAFTMDTYMDATLKMKQEAADKMDKFYNAVKMA